MSLYLLKNKYLFITVETFNIKLTLLADFEVYYTVL